MTDDLVNDEMERRLAAMEQPDRLALPLGRADFWMMAAVALILPVVMLAIAWGW
jgi:hypothetical protein